jgi:hypothetical protein
MEFTDNDDSVMESGNTNDTQSEENDDGSEETESTSSDSTMEDETPELPEYFDHVLQSPIVLDPPHQQLSNVFVLSIRFGCQICIHEECGAVVGVSKAFAQTSY